MAGRDKPGGTDRPRDGMERDNEQKCLAGWDGTGQNIGEMQDGTDGFLVIPRSSGADYKRTIYPNRGHTSLYRICVSSSSTILFKMPIEFLSIH